jgi:phosphohistidine phosphatase SixA
MMRSAIAVLTFAITLGGCARGAQSTALPASPSPSPLLVVIVRHAEKAPAPANDPVLSAAGIARAAALDSMLASMPITDVVVSHLQRTRLTAAPFIARTSATLHVVPIGSAGVEAHVKAVADTVRAISQVRGHTGVLVVGHSNTVAPIVAALGGGIVPPLCDSQYSRLFVLRGVPQGGVDRMWRAYGASDPVDAGCAAMK